jgi:hypothetical protein
MRTQYRRRLALTAAVIGLAATSLAIPGSAVARGTGDDAATPTGARPLSLPGLHDAAYHVTLLTGDQVTLTSAGEGRYSVVATPNPGTTPAIAVTARSGSQGNVARVSATPVAASALVAAGMLDPNLFDLTWLATHGDNGSAGVIPVTVQFSGKLSASALTGKAAALGGATVVATHPEAGTVDVKVSAAHAAPFWAALSGHSANGASAAPRLTGGAVHAWPTGDRSAVAHPSAGQVLNRVTETITGTRGSVFGCNGYLAVLCVEPGLALYGVDGEGIDTVYAASGMACVDDPCTTYQVTYSVPSGVYFASGFAFFLADSQDQWVDLVDPEVTVAGDTTFGLDVDTATKISIDTPRPSQAFNAELNDERTSVDGTATYDGIQALTPNYWAVPSAPVSAGTFHLSSAWVLGQPEVTMTVTAPQRLALDPSYFVYRTAATYGNRGAVRFTGRKKAELVNVGAGRPEDFAGVDARGKFVLMHEDDQVWCQDGSLAVVLDSQLNDAIQAGAVGVLFDPMSPGYDRGYCSSVIPEWYGQSDPIDMPFATISVDQGDALLKLLAKGPVTIDVSGYDGNSPYLYTPNLYQEGRVPASLHTTLTGAQLATVTDAYHSGGPSSADEGWSTWRSNEYFGIGSVYEGIAAPGTITEYRTAAPDVVTQRWLLGDQVNQLRWDMVTQPGSKTTQNWGAAPETPGSSTLSSDILRNQPGKYDGYPNMLAYCSFCRQGNTLYPVMFLSAGADPVLEDGAYGFSADSIHLYHGGQEVPQTPFAGGLVSYQLPAGAARYQLVAHDNTTTTTWDFTSSAPATDRTPIGTACLGTVLGSSDPCAPDPFVFLRYDPGTNLSNAVTGGGDHELRVTAYHQAPSPIAIRGLSVWTSTDGGKNWIKATVVGGHDGAFTVKYRTPSAPAANAKLSIKAQATDADGNDVTQTVIDAVALAAR